MLLSRFARRITWDRFAGGRGIAEANANSLLSRAPLGVSRSGLREVVEMRADLPVAVVESAAEGVEAVRAGIWPESAILDATAFDQLLTRVNVSLQPPTRFPVLFTLPFSIVRGLRP